jgi:hypothetical protein
LHSYEVHTFLSDAEILNQVELNICTAKHKEPWGKDNPSNSSKILEQ